MKEKHMPHDWIVADKQPRLAEAAVSRSRAEFDAMTRRDEDGRKHAIDSVSERLEELLAERDSLLNPPKDTFPNGSAFVLLGSNGYANSTAVVNKDDEGIWRYNGSIATWSQIVQQFKATVEVRQITQYVVLPQGDKFGATGEPVTGELTRGQRAAATRKRNAAAKKKAVTPRKAVAKKTVARKTTMTKAAAEALATSKPRKV